MRINSIPLPRCRNVRAMATWHEKCPNDVPDNATSQQHFKFIAELDMLHWAFVFLVVGLLAAVLGFSGIAGTTTQLAQILFVVFLVLFVVSLLFGRRRGPIV